MTFRSNECHHCGDTTRGICEEGSMQVGEPICHRCATMLRDDLHRPLWSCPHHDRVPA